MQTEVKTWGILPDGRNAHLIQMNNGHGIVVTVSDYGGVIQSILTPDRNGQAADIVLGYDTLEEYIKDGCYFGATVGRCANRIAGARFELNGRKYRLTDNENGNTLHGGTGFSSKLWQFSTDPEAVTFTYDSPDGEDGFPGNLRVDIRMTLSEEGVFRMEYHAVSNADTLCNLTGHSYFNLKGVVGCSGVQTATGYISEDSAVTGQKPAAAELDHPPVQDHGSAGRTAQFVAGCISDHLLQINASQYTLADAALIPTGEIYSVEGTSYDFRTMRPVGKEDLDGNLVLADSDHPAARVYETDSGRVLEVCTSLPGIQLYNGGGVTPRTGKGGIAYAPQSGMCLEPQFFPDAIHHPAFAAPILREGDVWNHYIEYRFSTE